MAIKTLSLLSVAALALLAATSVHAQDSVFRLELKSPIFFSSTPSGTPTTPGGGEGGSGQSEPSPDTVEIVASSARAVLGEAFSWAPSTGDLGGHGRWEIVGDLPGWAVLDTTTGRISGTPSGNPGSSGPLRAKLVLTGGDVLSDPFTLTTDFAFSVAAPNVTARRGQSFSAQAQVTTTGAMSYAKESGAAFVGIDTFGNIGGTVGTGTALGSHAYSVRATADGGAYGIGNGSITVLGALGFSTSPTNISVERGATASRPFAVSGSPVGPSYSIVRAAGGGTGAPPSWLTLVGNTVVAAPPASAAFGSHGSFQIAVKDAHQTSNTLSSAFSVGIPERLVFSNAYKRMTDYYQSGASWLYAGQTDYPLTSAEMACLYPDSSCTTQLTKVNSKQWQLFMFTTSSSIVESLVFKFDSGSSGKSISVQKADGGYISATASWQDLTFTVPVGAAIQRIVITPAHNYPVKVRSVEAVYR